MAKYATGKRSQAISDRSGMAFPYKEMVKEWNGSLVHISEFESEEALRNTLSLGNIYKFTITLFEPNEQRMTLQYKSANKDDKPKKD